MHTKYLTNLRKKIFNAFLISYLFFYISTLNRNNDLKIEVEMNIVLQLFYYIVIIIIIIIKF